jgi:hypothetical protein
LILSHLEYQHNAADVKTLGQVTCLPRHRQVGAIKKNVGQAPREVTADRGFDQFLKKQENCRRRWGVKQPAIPKKGKTPHPDSDKPWFRRALKQRVKIEPVIGHFQRTEQQIAF